MRLVRGRQGTCVKRRVGALILGGLMLLVSLAAGGALAQTEDTVVQGGPRLEVLAPASPLPAKERVNLFLEVVNLGPGTIRNLSVFIQPASGSGLVVVGQLTRGLEDIPQNDSDLLVLRVATPDTEGSASLSLRFTFTGPNGETIVRERLVNVQIKPPISDPLEIERVATPLAAGGDSTVTFELRNPHDTAITDLDVLLDVETEIGGALAGGASDSVSPGSQSSYIVQGGRLGAGETTTVDMPVLAGLRADELVTMKLTATYSLEGFRREQVFDFGARVVGDVSIRVLEAREVDTGTGLEVAGTVVNVGAGTAWNPRVVAAEGSGLRSDALLIEDLEPNEAVSFRLPVQRVGDRIPGAPLFAIDWNDDYGNVVAPQAISGQLAELPPAAPSRFDAIRAWLAATPGVLWAFLLFEILLLAVLALAMVHASRVRERAGSASEGATVVRETPAPGPGPAPPPAQKDEGRPRRAPWWRRPPQKPKGKSGARPGG